MESQSPVEQALADSRFLELLGTSPIWTPEIEELAGVLCANIRLDFPGMAVFGQQRTGKSSACEFLIKILVSAVGAPLAMFQWNIADADCTERSFTQDVMLQSGCHAIASRDIAVLRNRFYDHIAQVSQELGARRVVVVIDEAQNLRRNCFAYLIKIDNELNRRRLKPFFLLVGQPELARMASAWLQADGHQVLGRFLGRQHPFRGILLSDIGPVLEQFSASSMEEGRLDAVFPSDLKSGWRLSDWTSALQEAFGICAAKQSIPDGQLRVPMQYLRAVVLAMLYEALDERLELRSSSTVNCLRGIRYSGFESVLSYYVETERSERSTEARGSRV